MDWFVVLPPIIAIAVVMWKKEVVLALLIGLLSSEFLLLVMASPLVPSSLFQSVINTINAITGVFSSEGNVRLILFSLIVGALLNLVNYAGGITGTVKLFIEKGIVNSKRGAACVPFITGFVVFIESNLSSLTAGMIGRGVFDKYGMSRARLAYIIDSTSAPVCALILFNSWGAYIIGLLGEYPLQESLATILVGSMQFNFYALITLAIVLYTIIFDKTAGPLRDAEERAQGKLAGKTKETAAQVGKARYLLVPLLVLISAMVFFMYVTGEGDLAKGDGTLSVMYSSILACGVLYTMLTLMDSFNHKELVDVSFEGMGQLLPLVFIVLLSLALGASLNALGTGRFIATLVAENVALALIPCLLFLAGALISFTTGTSWGTFALLIPIGIPMALELQIAPSLVLGAILSGGVFGDHCSPISDTTAVSAVAAGCDLFEHVKTQLPYALVGGMLTFIAYLLYGFMAI
jgi:tetracycline resistance efflux pump